MNRFEKGEDLHLEVEAALKDLSLQLAEGHTQEFLDMLSWYSKLWTYSFWNSILIRNQCPHATVVAGYKRWQQLGFSVRRGEKGIAIRAPWIKKLPDPQTGEITEKLVGYLATYVWDITQTNEYPDKQPPDIYKPVTGDWEELYQHLKVQMILHEVGMSEHPLPEGIHGLYSNHHVYVNEALEPFHKVTTAIHEYVHHVAHGTPEGREGLTRNQREREAEQVTYVVCQTIGIEHPTARDYLLAYQYTTEDVSQSIRRTQQLVKQVMQDLDLLQEKNGEMERHSKAA